MPHCLKNCLVWYAVKRHYIHLIQLLLHAVEWPQYLLQTVSVTWKPFPDDLDQLPASPVQDRSVQAYVKEGEVPVGFGMMFSKPSLSPNPKNTKIIKEGPPPENKATVNSFLQTCQFSAVYEYPEPISCPKASKRFSYDSMIQVEGCTKTF